MLRQSYFAHVPTGDHNCPLLRHCYGLLQNRNSTKIDTILKFGIDSGNLHRPQLDPSALCSTLSFEKWHHVERNQTVVGVACLPAYLGGGVMYHTKSWLIRTN